MVADIRVQRGIGQGCPMRGSLFALALDPLFRCLMWQHTLRIARYFVFAGALAAVLAKIRRTLPIVIDVRRTLVRGLRPWARSQQMRFQIPLCGMLESRRWAPTAATRWAWATPGSRPQRATSEPPSGRTRGGEKLRRSSETELAATLHEALLFRRDCGASSHTVRGESSGSARTLPCQIASWKRRTERRHRGCARALWMALVPAVLHDADLSALLAAVVPLPELCCAAR